ncbi:MAG: protoporphyrinogen/coproporphyrinogen oxidase [Dehalococcoidia bacterium]
MTDSGRVAILGAGLAGLSAAYHLPGWDCHVYDQHPYYGGHAHSWSYGGFIFDEGPHVSFTKSAKVRELFARSVGGGYYESMVIASNYFYGHILAHPAQTNLYGLPEALVQGCIGDLAQAEAELGGTPANYAEWCYQNLGRTFSEEFTFRYTRKYWTLDPRRMTTDWIGVRVYRPSLPEVIAGATNAGGGNHYYIQEIRYPQEGGFYSFTHLLAQGRDLRLGHQLVELDLRSRRLTFANGRSEHYDHLISSLPLPELVRVIKDAPAPVRDAAQELSCSSIVIVNVGLKGNSLPHCHWMYFYDDDIIFSRVSFPHMLSPNNVPPGHSSLQAEVYFSKHRPLPVARVTEKVLSDLRRVGLLRDADDIVLCRTEWVQYGNVIFDEQRARSLATVRRFLEGQRVLPCGRYGEWAYFWTDQAVLSGEKAAKQLRWGSVTGRHPCSHLA